MPSDTSIERESVLITTSDGNYMQAYMVLPSGRAAPGIVIAQEIFGVNASLREVADEYAGEGFAVIVPDLFWRIRPGIELGYTDADRQEAFGLLKKFDAGKAVQDLNDAASWLGRREAVSSVAVLGFCLGGRLAILAAAANPGYAAAISFYGVRADENVDEIRAINCPFQFHVGDNDSQIPLEAVKVVEESIADRPNARLFIYPGAQHAFFNKDRGDTYDLAASRLAKERVLSTLRSAQIG